MFGIRQQASVSRTIDRIAPALKVYSIPEKICSGTKRISSAEDLMDVLPPKLVCLTDASEQRICRPKRRNAEKLHYSGKVMDVCCIESGSGGSAMNFVTNECRSK